ncbi:MAG: DUF1444 family protein, partial [Myxococcales bacterium]|nr:DUF1444 family protein [Myxococcales bacterium]
DSPSPRAELARWVRQAEAEANGTGPLARIVQMLLRKLPTDDGFRLVHHFEHDLRFACGIELSIARAVRATEDLEAHAAESAVDKLISLVTAQSAPLPLPWEQIQGDVFPRLVPSTFVDELARRSEQTRSILVSPFPNDLRLAFVLRRGDRARFIRTDELGTWGVRHVELLEAAVANLAAASTKASFSEVMTTDGPLVVARSGDGLDAARLLLPGLHAVLSNHLGGDIAVAVPHRDALYAVDASNTPLVHQLRRKAEDDARRAPHRITTDLFRVGKSRLEPLAIRAS